MKKIHLKQTEYQGNTQQNFPSRISILMYFLRGSKKYFLGAIIFVTLRVFFELLNPRIIGYTVDFIIGAKENLPAFIWSMIEVLGGRDYALHHLYVVALLVIALAILGMVFRYLFQLFNGKGAERLVERMRNCLYEQIMQLPVAWQDVNQTGDIIQRCTSDVDMIRNFLAEQLTGMIRMLILICMALLFMGRIHVGLTLIAMIFIPIVVLYALLFHNRIGSAFEKIDAEEGRLSATAQENLTGVRVVRAFGRENFEKERFMKRNEGYTKMWVDMMRLLSSFWSLNDLISGLQIMTVVSVGAYLAVHGQISAGGYAAFITYNGLLTQPVRELGRTISDMSKTGISVDRIRYIMNSEIEKDAPDAVDFPQFDTITFQNVSFGYETAENNSQKVLEQVSFSIPKGKTIGILGPTGSGKSTMVQLLNGLYELPEAQGDILIGDTSIRKIRRKELRKHIGMVLQEPYLFSRSLWANLIVAASDATQDSVLQAVKIASLEDAVSKFRDGYETKVGERGVTLSGGQKQRTAIAQMLLRDCEIMIFDDSLSAVDAQTDARIRAALKSVMANATVILISHRITTLMDADEILVLEQGRLIEQGSHENLLAQNGMYRQIYDLQMTAE